MLIKFLIFDCDKRFYYNLRNIFIFYIIRVFFTFICFQQLSFGIIYQTGLSLSKRFQTGFCRQQIGIRFQICDCLRISSRKIIDRRAGNQ